MAEARHTCVCEDTRDARTTPAPPQLNPHDDPYVASPYLLAPLQRAHVAQLHLEVPAQVRRRVLRHLPAAVPVVDAAEDVPARKLPDLVPVLFVCCVVLLACLSTAGIEGWCRSTTSPGRAGRAPQCTRSPGRSRWSRRRGAGARACGRGMCRRPAAPRCPRPRRSRPPAASQRRPRRWPRRRCWCSSAGVPGCGCCRSAWRRPQRPQQRQQAEGAAEPGGAVAAAVGGQRGSWRRRSWCNWWLPPAPDARPRLLST